MGCLKVRASLYLSARVTENFIYFLRSIADITGKTRKNDRPAQHKLELVYNVFYCSVVPEFMLRWPIIFTGGILWKAIIN